MATNNPTVIPFPVRSGNPKTSAVTSQLLKAARAAYSALILAVPHGEQNTIVRQLGDAIRAADPPHSPIPPATDGQRKPIAPAKITEAVAVRLLRELRGDRCVCGRDKKARRPFCRACYFALPDQLRAAMWLSAVDDCHHLLDRIVTARAHLRAMGILSASEVIA